jgi:two-component system, sporulation sensor kinase D
VSIYEKKQRWKFILLFAAISIGAGSLFYTNRLVNTIAQDERKKIELWAEATRILINTDLSSSGSSTLFTLQVV